MMKRFYLSFRIVMLLVWVGVATGCMDTPPSQPTLTLQPTVPPTMTVQPTLIGGTKLQATATADATLPAYALPGNYLVGVREGRFYRDEEANTVHVFFPSNADGSPDLSDAPYPLIVFSPHILSRVNWYLYSIPNLVTHGFVVISWNTHETIEKVPTSFVNRPREASTIIDLAETMTAEYGPLAGMIDMEQVGMAGNGWGGGTALLVGGAQWNFGWCAAHEDTYRTIPEITCKYLYRSQTDIAAMLNLENPPEGDWPSFHDPRVQAVLAMAPIGNAFGADYQGVAAITVPTMIMAGAKDEILPAKDTAYPIYENLGSQEKYQITFAGKGHEFFLTHSIHEYDYDQYKINYFATAFWLAELKHDAEALKVLSPANKKIDGVMIETTVSD